MVCRNGTKLKRRTYLVEKRTIRHELAVKKNDNDQRGCRHDVSMHFSSGALSAQITDGCTPLKKSLTGKVQRYQSSRYVEWHPGWHLVHFRIEFRNDDRAKIIHTVILGRGQGAWSVLRGLLCTIFRYQQRRATIHQRDCKKIFSDENGDKMVMIGDERFDEESMGGIQVDFSDFLRRG